jgi:hypothetical protein
LTTPLQQLAEEFLGRFLVALALHKNVEDISLLVHGPPEIVPFATDGQKHLIEVPLVARSRAPTAQQIGIGLPKFPAPIPHRLVRQDDAALRHELFDVPVTEAETKVQPDAMTDDLRWEPMALIWIDCR